MALEDYSPDIESTEGVGSASEAMREAVSEKFKEAVKKGQAGIKRVQKDEKKARRYDTLLAHFLVHIITDKKYDSLLAAIFTAMDKGYSSNFLLGILSLVRVEVSDKIRTISGKETISFKYEISEEPLDFDDTHLPEALKNRINYWIEDIIDANLIDTSELQASRNLELLEKDQAVIVKFTAQVFTFFLYELKVKIGKVKALSIADFIISQVTAELKKIHFKEL